MSTDEPARSDEASTEETNTAETNTAEANTDSAPVRRASPTRRARRIGGLNRPTPGTDSRSDLAARPDSAADRAADTTADTTANITADPTADATADTTADTPADSTAPTDAAPTRPSEAPAPEAGGSEALVTAEAPEAVARPATEVPAWLRWLPAAALGLAAVVMLVFFLIVSHGVWWGRPSAQAVREQVLAAAKTCTVATNSWHFNSFAADEAKGVACTTGSRTSDYQKAMEHVIKPLAMKLQASQVAQVNYAGVSDVSPDGDSWNVLVVGQLTVRQKTNPQGRQDPFAALVRMDHVHGKWLMARIQEVAGPAAR